MSLEAFSPSAAPADPPPAPDRPFLSDAHRRDLEDASGIPAAMVEARGYYTATTKAELQRLGFAEAQRLVPALVVPMWWDGAVVAHQIKPDAPRFKDGHVLKYETPAGSAVRLDCPPACQRLLTDPACPIWITEGVKKADAAAARGLCCVALIGVWNWKAGAALPEWHDVRLKGRTVYIAFDSDATTKRGVQLAMRALGEWLGRKGASVRYVRIPSLDGRKVGLDDAFAAGLTPADLVDRASSEPPAIVVADEHEGRKRYPLTELGNAERLIDSFGEDLRWCHQLRRWLVWSGKHWEVDETGGAPVWRAAQEVVRAMYREAQETADSDDRKALASWALRSENANPLSHMVDLAKTLPGVAVTVEALDLGEDLLNLGNGTLNLRTFEMRPHDRADLITRLIDVPYDPEAACPRWLDFLDVVLRRNEALLRYVWKACGYSLSGATHEKCFFFLHGYKGDNGKSVFVDTLLWILGPYASRTSTDTILDKDRDGGVPNDLARLRGARVVAAAEIGEGKRLNEAVIKEITGGDVVTARFMRAEWFDFKPAFKVWMTGNYKPSIRGQDPAIWNRVKLIPFTYSVPKEDQDGELGLKLRAEAAGILAWMIEGAMAWRAEGLTAPDEVRSAVEAYREEMDVLGAFLRDCCTEHENERVNALKLYQAYEKWSELNGQKPMTNTSFGRRLGERGFEKDHTRTGKFYTGIGLAPDETLDRVYRGGD